MHDATVETEKAQNILSEEIVKADFKPLLRGYESGFLKRPPNYLRIFGSQLVCTRYG